jgi:SAM-dependent methyltransferase
VSEAPQLPRYERIGRTYAATRRTDPRIAARIWHALGDARSVVNVGAGTGSYEPPHLEVLAVEPSAVMAAQRPPEAAPVVLARAEELPLADDSFDAAMAIITIHHWTDAAAGIAEMRRVARDRIVVLTFDTRVTDRAWLRDYAPRIREFDRDFPSLEELGEWMGGAEVTAVPSPNDCVDVFMETLIGRPELVLDPVVRANCSGCARLPAAEEAALVERLRADLESGEWDRRHGHLRRMDEHDGGLRLLVGPAA